MENGEFFHAFKAFGCGVLIATALIHMLPPAFEGLQDIPALKSYPVAGFFALTAILLMHLVEYAAVESVLKSGVRVQEGEGNIIKRTGALHGDEHPHDHDTSSSHSHQEHDHSHGHDHATEQSHPAGDDRFTDDMVEDDETGPLLTTATVPIPRFRGLDYTTDFPPTPDPTGRSPLRNQPVIQVTFRIVQPKNCSHSHIEQCRPTVCGHTHVDAFDLADLQRRKVSTYILFLSVALHSVIIGSTLGMVSDAAFFGLLAALVFHQGFEGLALGVKLVESHKLDPGFGTRASNLPTVLLSLLFVLAAPMGVILGIFLRSLIDPDSEMSRVVQGSLEALSAGVLIYVGLVTFLSGELNVHTGTTGGKAAMMIMLWLGAAAMVVVGIWA